MSTGVTLWIMIAFAAVTAGLGYLLAVTRTRASERAYLERKAAADAEVAALGARVRAAHAPPEIAIVLIALPLSSRVRQTITLRGAPSGHAIALEALVHLRTAESPRRAAIFCPASASGAAPDAMAEVALDALLARDRSTEPRGFRDGAGQLSTPHGALGVLAIAIVARGLRDAPSFDDVDGLLRALEAITPPGTVELLHHAARWIPVDPSAGFDEAALSRAFPELRPV